MSPDQIRRLRKYLSQPEANLVFKHLQALAEEKQAEAIAALMENNPDLAVSLAEDAREVERLIVILRKMAADAEVNADEEPVEYEYTIPIDAQTI